MKILDAAVGDTSILAKRYHLVDFSQPYIESGLDMVVTQKPVEQKETWMFFNAFTKQMWLMMAATHIFMGFVIWLIEREVNAELKGLGALLWFLVTIIFQSYGKSCNIFLCPTSTCFKRCKKSRVKFVFFIFVLSIKLGFSPCSFKSISLVLKL